MNNNRLESFSDAVMAVAITLLALDLKIDRVAGQPLVTQLWNQWPSFAAYLVSFAIIGLIWISHHTLFRRATGVDKSVMVYNLLLLMFVTMIPFATAAYADFLEDGGANARVAVLIYGIVMTGNSFLLTLILRRLIRSGLFVSELTPEQARKLLYRYSVGSFAYPLITAIGMLKAPLMLILYVPLIAYYFGPGNGALKIEPASPVAGV